MSCVLRAYGANFDVDFFLKDSLLKPLIVYHCGEPRFPNSSRRLDEVSGMNVSVSTCEFSDLRGRLTMRSNFYRTTIKSYSASAIFQDWKKWNWIFQSKSAMWLSNATRFLLRYYHF